MDQAKLNIILKNVLQNVFKLENVSNIIGQFKISNYNYLIEITEKAIKKKFITYIYENYSLKCLSGINKYYKHIYLGNNPKNIKTDKYSCIYYDSIKHIRAIYSDHKNTDLDCRLYLCKDFKHNLTRYIFRSNKYIYIFINKYKINNLIYKKNVKHYAYRNELHSFNELLHSLNESFINYNFAYSYNIFYLFL